MAEPLTKEELALARGYAESVYADTSDPQKHAAAVMMLRLLDTLATLEAENARLREKAEVGEAVGNLPLGWSLLHDDRPTGRGMRTVFNEQGCGVMTGVSAEDALLNTPTLRAAKGEEPDHAH